MAWTEKLPNGLYRGCWRDAAGAKRSATRNADGRKFTQPKQAMDYAIYKEGAARTNGPQNDGKGMGERPRRRPVPVTLDGAADLLPDVGVDESRR
jgi:hypothetical protein